MAGEDGGNGSGSACVCQLSKPAPVKPQLQPRPEPKTEPKPEPKPEAKEPKPEPKSDPADTPPWRDEPAASKPTPAPAPTSKPAPEPEPPVPASEPDRSAEPGDLWLRLLSEARDKKRLIRPWLEAGTLEELKNGVCTLAFPDDQTFAMESLAMAGPRRFLEETLSALTGQPVAIRFEKRAGLQVAPVELPERVQKPVVDPMEEFKNDPLIRRALEIFKAEIQPS